LLLRTRTMTPRAACSAATRNGSRLSGPRYGLTVSASTAQGASSAKVGLGVAGCRLRDVSPLGIQQDEEAGGLGVSDDPREGVPPVLAQALEQRRLRLDDPHVRGDEINGATTELVDCLCGARLVRRHRAATEGRGQAVEVGIEPDTERVAECPHPPDHPISKALRARCVLLPGLGIKLQLPDG